MWQVTTLPTASNDAPPMMIHHALGVAGRARGVVERDRIPFIARHGPGEIGITLG